MRAHVADAGVRLPGVIDIWGRGLQTARSIDAWCDCTLAQGPWDCVC